MRKPVFVFYTNWAVKQMKIDRGSNLEPQILKGLSLSQKNGADLWFALSFSHMQNKQVFSQCALHIAYG